MSGATEESNVATNLMGMPSACKLRERRRVAQLQARGGNTDEARSAAPPSCNCDRSRTLGARSQLPTAIRSELQLIARLSSARQERSGGGKRAFSRIYAAEKRTSSPRSEEIASVAWRTWRMPMKIQAIMPFTRN